MVVVHRALGFRFVIYRHDHEPAHVHITGAGQAKIKLPARDGRLQVVFSIGITRSDMRRLVAEVLAHKNRLLAEWERIHGRGD